MSLEITYTSTTVSDLLYNGTDVWFTECEVYMRIRFTRPRYGSLGQEYMSDSDNPQCFLDKDLNPPPLLNVQCPVTSHNAAYIVGPLPNSLSFELNVV